MKKNKFSVCHLTSVHPVEDVRIFHKECVSLAKHGFDVTLVACGEPAYKQNKNGVNVVSLDVPVKNRFERMTKRTRAVYKKALEVDADIYHFHDPELLPYGLKLKRKGKKVIFDSHEDVYFDIINKKYLPKFTRIIVGYLYKQYEKRVLKKFDAVISVTPHIVEKLKKINPKTYQITNYPILNKDTPSLDKPIKSDTPTIVFAGGVNPIWMHETILDAITSLNIRYLLAGPCSADYLVKLKKHPSWQKVDYMGVIPHAQVKEYMHTAHIGIVLLNYSDATGGKLGTLGNTKLFEVMAAGLPIVCTDFTLWRQIVEDNQTGICVNPNDVQAIKNAIETLIQNPEKAIQMGKRGKEVVYSDYSWETQEKKLLNIYNNI